MLPNAPLYCAGQMVYIFWSTFTFFKLVCSDFHWLTRTLARHPLFTSLNTSLAKIGFRSSHQGEVKVFECHAPAKVVLVVPTKVILLVGGHKVVLIDANHGDTGGGQQSR